MNQVITISIETYDGKEPMHDLTHWNDRIELIRVIERSVTCVINGESKIMDTGDICIINRQQLHMIHCNNSSCKIQRLLVDPVIFASNKVIYNKYLVPPLTDPTVAHIKVGKRKSADIARLMDRMVELNATTPVAYELELIAMVYLLFQRLFMIYQSESGKHVAPSTTDLVLFRRMADFIYNNYPKKITLDDIAAAANVSKSKCGNVFKEFSGHTPVDYLNLYRLLISTDLLRSTNTTISEIAYSCGFGQQSYFNRLFLREYGVTPKEYRERSYAGETNLL